MAQPILVPQVGQDLTEAKIVELFVKLGDTVKKGDLVAVVESEKASFEVEAFAEGIVISLPFAVGDVAPVLEPLMHLGAAGEEIAIDATIAPAAAPAASPADTGPPTVALAMAPLRAGGNGGPVNAARRASPVAKVQAAARGLDVADIAGSGPGGAVVLKDVLALASSAGAGGDTLEIRTLQSGQGTPVVFLHGFGADLSAWRPLLADLGLGLPLMA
ncbi:MAG: biotin/lipoyl-containing protein, partial [Rhodobacterales bacterium]